MGDSAEPSSNLCGKISGNGPPRELTLFSIDGMVIAITKAIHSLRSGLMITFSRFLIGAIIAAAPSLLYAQGTESTGSIAGNADPGAQVVVTGTESGSVIGIM